MPITESCCHRKDMVKRLYTPLMKLEARALEQAASRTCPTAACQVVSRAIHPAIRDAAPPIVTCVANSSREATARLPDDPHRHRPRPTNLPPRRTPGQASAADSHHVHHPATHQRVAQRRLAHHQHRRPDRGLERQLRHLDAAPPQPEISEAEVRQLAGQVRQLLRGGDAEGALRGCLETPVYNGTDGAKEAHLQTIIEVLQSIKASDMSPLLRGIYESPGGSESLDVLMKYIYKGMAMGSNGGAGRTPSKVTPQSTGGFSQIGARPGVSNEPATAAMSVLLSWHEKLVDVAGLGCIGRTMTDWRRV
ncbi:hypothetical protein ACCO45_005124 [Purpureocillium lilacinum]|uniref:Uncharacterized protein n=1 Tax=Purpureocillium lilacinum TaxID=33203 RepID=A0ACC4DUH8_PURLI